MRPFLLNLTLLLTALVLACVFFPIGVLVTVLNAIREGSPGKIAGYLSKAVLSAALCVDVAGNTLCRDLLNGWLRKQPGYEFGNYQETISKVLGKNKATGTLTDAGRALANLLNFIQTNHVENAAND